MCHPAAHGELRRLGPIEYRTSNVSARFFATSAIACSLVGIFRIRNRTTRPPGSGSDSSTIQNVPSFAWHFWTRRLALPACVTSRSRVSPVRYARLPRLRAIRSICPREDKADGAVDRGDRGRQRQRYSSSPLRWGRRWSAAHAVISLSLRSWKCPVPGNRSVHAASARFAACWECGTC